MHLRPLKLALVTRRFPPLIGGAEKVLSYLAPALAAEGADVTVVTSEMPGREIAKHEDALFEKTNSRGTTVQVEEGRLSVVRLETSRLRFWGTWRYMRNLERWFLRNRVDLAYVSMLKHDAYVVIRAGNRLGFPVVLRPEGAGVTGDVAWSASGNFGRIIGRACRRAEAFVSISKSVEEELQQSLHSGTMRPSRLVNSSSPKPSAPRIVSIPNGVPIPNSSWHIRTGWHLAPRAVFVGRLAPEKGLDTLITAWPRVRLRFPTAQLVLIGEGSERTALELLAETLGLTLGPAQAVEFPGSVDVSADAFRNAELFVLPSREEGMSIALLEAMALGIPVVASSISGNQRLVDDFKHGRLVPRDDPISLARTIIDQWENLDRAIQMGLAARSRVELEFSIQTVARKHLTLFRELVTEIGHTPGPWDGPPRGPVT
jgi:glycosyltransferase involved in cell wall biosynthesis